MDDYDIRRLSAYRDRTLRIALDDTAALIAADPGLTDDDIRMLTEPEASAVLDGFPVSARR